MYTLIGFNTKLAPCSVKLSDGKAWWDWPGSCTNFSSSLSPLLVLCKNIWFHQNLLITNTGWSTVMLDTLLDWEAGWISFFKFLTNHDVYIMKFLYVWHFLRQSDIWFIGTGGLSDCVKIQSIKHMWSNTNLMEPPALRHGPPDGGWDSMVAKLQSHILLGPTAQRWVFWIVESFGVGTTSLRSMNGTKPAVAMWTKTGSSDLLVKRRNWNNPRNLVTNTRNCICFPLVFQNASQILLIDHLKKKKKGMGSHLVTNTLWGTLPLQISNCVSIKLRVIYSYGKFPLQVHVSLFMTSLGGQTGNVVGTRSISCCINFM